ncbi:protein FD-like [Dorcoceras hygrometricum]|uniref:Protein FD-like n=1 Tax=Dorcoceras hygrometricum TaxID=472368 RepID=A0A2Z7BGK9_9LAMI|nr:protein FD-like [Dorcoceras hygrometricum]
MDDVWKGLTLSSLNHRTISTGSSGISAAQPPISDLGFQDLLSGPGPLINQIHRSVSDGQKSCSSSDISKPQMKTRAASGSCSDENAVVRKRIRLMKNRESAARSRARKQAYTYELELQVAHLSEENARLRRQQQDKQCDAGGDERPKKNKLHRTLTAPF